MHQPGEAAAESTVSQAQSHRIPLKSPAGFTNPRRQNSTPGVPVMLTAQKELSETAPGASGSEQIGRMTCGSNALVLGRERPAQLAEPEENHNWAQGETSQLYPLLTPVVALASQPFPLAGQLSTPLI